MNRKARATGADDELEGGITRGRRAALVGGVVPGRDAPSDRLTGTFDHPPTVATTGVAERGGYHGVRY